MRVLVLSLDYLITRHSDLKRKIQMKVASFIANNKSTYGVLAGDELLEPGDAFRARYPD